MSGVLWTSKRESVHLGSERNSLNLGSPKTLSKSPTIFVVLKWISRRFNLTQYRKEASDSRGTGAPETRASEEEVLQSRQGHSEFGDTAVIQLEGALRMVAIVMTGGHNA